MRKISLLATALVAATLTPAPAKADTITVGWWDNSLPNQGITTIYSQNSFDLFTLNHVSFGPTFFGVLSALQTSDGFYESAINNVFTNISGTARIYVSFTGVDPVGGTLPPYSFLDNLFQRSEDPLPTWTLAEQIFVCSGVVYCDNFVVGGGTLVDTHHFTNGQTGTLFTDVTFNSLPFTTPFTITEVFHIVAPEPNAHLAGAIWTAPAAVPGPIVGAGLPGLLAALGGWLAMCRYRRRPT